MLFFYRIDSARMEEGSETRRPKLLSLEKANSCHVFHYMTENSSPNQSFGHVLFLKDGILRIIGGVLGLE